MGVKSEGDAGIATEENIAWLVANHYRYLVVSRKRHRQFSEDGAVRVKGEGDLRVEVQRVVNESGEVELYCHSTQREKKEQGIQELFAKRFEETMEKLAGGLHKKGVREEVREGTGAFGPLEQKYARTAQYYDLTEKNMGVRSFNPINVGLKDLTPIFMTPIFTLCLPPPPLPQASLPRRTAPS